MIKPLLIASFIICSANPTISQTNYLTDIKTKGEFRYPDSSINILINYWRFDTCLTLPKICKYNTSTAAKIRVYQSRDAIRFLLLQSNNSGYKSKHICDSMMYCFFPNKVNSSFLIRKIWIDKGSSVKDDIYVFKTDTFSLKVIDTLFFSGSHLINKIFKTNKIKDKKQLRIFVFKSLDTNGSIMLHYWTENIGVIKLTDEKCWRYSFEMKDDRTKSIEKMFEELLALIKTKYKDPHWLSEPCYFE